MKSLSRKIGAAALVAALCAGPVLARPVTTREGILPQGTELNDDAPVQANEVVHSELAGGARSDLSLLGDMAFNSPLIFGGAARQAGLSCGTCHQQGHNNAALFIPGLSTRPGTYDGTNALFSAPTDNHVLDAVTPPSLRGARDLWPYTHNGRFATLQDFVRNAIVNEFGGAEPSRRIVDAITAYVQDIAFLPNPKLGMAGRLTEKASEPARRGEAIFNRPFRKDPALSCAACHQPSGAFVDHRVHDVGSGGTFKTPTLINANFSAPYFHDGRYKTYSEVIDHFDRLFDLGLADNEKRDLAAYLDAVGDAAEPEMRASVANAIQEIDGFAPVLEKALADRDTEAARLAADTIGLEWRELGEKFPEKSIAGIMGGEAERARAARAIRGVVLVLRAIDMAVADGNFADAANEFTAYRRRALAALSLMQVAQPWSLFDERVSEAEISALQRLAELAK